MSKITTVNHFTPLKDTTASVGLTSNGIEMSTISEILHEAGIMKKDAATLEALFSK